jgi:hypothetical protein
MPDKDLTQNGENTLLWRGGNLHEINVLPGTSRAVPFFNKNPIIFLDNAQASPVPV